MPDIPHFLQRAENGVGPAPATTPGARAPFATVPPAPPAALAAVMGLPTRR